MPVILSRFSQLLALAGGRDSSELSRAGQTTLAITGVLGALAFSSLWGLAAGSSSAELALTAALKVPLVILLAAVASFPAGLLALRLSGARLRGGDLIVSFAASMFAGALVLAVLAPIVAIYYHTSAAVGVPLALGSAVAALITAAVLFARSAFQRAARTGGWGTSLVAVAVLVALYSAALVQIIALASPIVGAGTPFDSGVDGWLR